jgi:TRAP-type mannitol/chloroaromatic compound transport system permease large subunit
VKSAAQWPASTGVVGASVVAMGVISLPVMLKHNYKKTLSTGVICASGTLGQIIPPSIVLISTATMSEIGGTMALATLKYFSALPKLHLLLLKRIKIKHKLKFYLLPRKWDAQARLHLWQN